MSRIVPSILPYTLLKKESDGSPLLVFLLWRDRRSSSSESSAFWSSIVCPPHKEDNSPLDSVTRGFSEKTKGIFAPREMVFDSEHELEIVQRKSPPKQKIEESRIFMRKKLIKGDGVTLLSIRQYITYVAPVRFIDTETLNSTFGYDKGEVEWVTAQDLFGALYSTTPDNSLCIRGHSYHTATRLSPHPVKLPLALPFTVTLRTDEARQELAAILKQFKVDVDATIKAPPTTEGTTNEDENEMPNVSGLKVTDSSSSSSSSNDAVASSSSSSSSSSSASSSRAPSKNYSCRKCRKLLFTDLDLSTHTEPLNGGGRFAHKHIPLNQGGRRVGVECSSYFVENVSALGEFPPGEGNLVCSKCQTRYGSYCWSGTQCSCGEWIVPAFQVVKSKVDERSTAGPNRATHISFQFQRPPPRVAATAPQAASSVPTAEASSSSSSSSSTAPTQP